MFNKHNETSQRFAIKKYTFGVASALVGVFFFSGANAAQAEEVKAETSVTSVATPAAEPAPTPVIETIAATTIAPKAEVTTAAAPVVTEAPKTEKGTSLVAEEKVEAPAPKAETTTQAPATTSAPKAETTTAAQKPRVAAVNYKVQYTDVATKAVVYTAPSKIAVADTTQPKAEIKETVKAELSAPALADYRLADGQAESVLANIIEGAGKNNLVNFNVVKNTVATAPRKEEEAPAVGEGTRFYSTVTEETPAADLPAPGTTTQPVISGWGELLKADAVANPVMTDANGAVVNSDPRLLAVIKEGYQIDPGKDRITFAIGDFMSLNNELAIAGRTEELYFTTSFDAKREDGGTKSLFVAIYDKTANKLLENIELAVENKEYRSTTLEALAAQGFKEAEEFNFARLDSDQGGSFRSTLTTSKKSVNHINTIYSLTEKNKIGQEESYPQFKDTMVSLQRTEYVAKNPDGTTTPLGVWTTRDWAGQQYTSSGERQFEGYELVQKPKDEDMTGLLGVRPVVGYKWEDTRRGLNYDGKYKRFAQRLGEVVNDQGAVVFTIISATNADMTEDVKVEYTSEPVYPLGHVFPDGTVADGFAHTGNMALTVNGKDVPGARFQYNSRGFKLQNSVFSASEDVLYVYEPQGTVTVHYVDTKGTEIAVDVVDTKPSLTGTAYDTAADNKPEIIEKDGAKYYLKETATEGTVGGTTVVEVKDGQTVDAETGTVKASNFKNVIYVYEKEGDVVVNYVDEAGNVIATKVTDTPVSKPGTDYDTAADNKPQKITTPEGKVYELIPTATKGNETGKVEDGKTIEVTYVYKEIKGDVVVNYVDTLGNVIATKKVDTPESSVGTEYDTAVDNKPETIEFNGKVYTLVPDLTKGTEKGKVVPGTTEITYVYATDLGDVLVNYINTKGEVIKAPVLDTPLTPAGETYNTADDNKPTTITAADGKTYTLLPALTIGKETGEVINGRIEVTYVYEEVKGDVVVNYVDEAGNVIANPVTDTPETSTGTDYDTTDNKPTIIKTDDKTYALIPTATKGTEAGKVVPGTTEITYVYKELKGDVVVNYVDEAGNVLAPKVTDTPESSLGTAYDTAVDNKPAKITTVDGKTYVLIPEATKGLEVGQVVEGTTEITYVYKEVKGDVVVNYVDEAGNVIANPVTDTPETSTGTDYNTTDNKPSTITTADGKTYVLVPEATKGAETGKVVEGTTQVTYVYKEVKGDVVVNYVNEAGEVIATKVTDTPETSTGTDYDTTDNKPGKIVAPDGKTYVLVPELTKGTEAGKVAQGTTEVTYVYRELTKGNNVVVNYVDENGNVIKNPVEDTKDSSTGVEYNTADNKPNTITTADGKTYELIPTATIGNENGKVVEGTTQVTYVYKEVKGNVVVNYVDEKGNVLATKVTDTPDSSTGVDYNTADNKPNTITTADGKTYELVRVEGSETGKVVPGTTTVTYVYKEVAPKEGNVVVNYVDENGNVLQTPVNDTFKTAVGTDYNTTDYKPTTIVVNGKTYELVRTEGNETGKVVEGTTNVTYVYKEVTPKPAATVTTKHVDTKGNVVAPGTEGTTGKVSVDGYVYVETTTDKDGNTTHVYRPVTTTFVDENGNVLAPGKDGKHPYANVEGYVYVGTETDPVTGDTKHVYRPVTKGSTAVPTPAPAPTKEVTTTYVDEQGNVLLAGKTGTHAPANIPGYVLVTTKDANGNTVHVYRKVTKATPKPQAKPVAKPAAKPAVKAPAKKVAKAGALPKTSAAGTETNSALPAGLAAALAAAGLLAARRRREEEK